MFTNGLKPSLVPTVPMVTCRLSKTSADLSFHADVRFVPKATTFSPSTLVFGALLFPSSLLAH
jgi:hypothetical protein